jgi:hypothetical protein
VKWTAADACGTLGSSDYIDLEDCKPMKKMRDRRRQPTHPGAILRDDVLPALRMS